jgi:phosphohistidine phosphatase SixA
MRACILASVLLLAGCGSLNQNRNFAPPAAGEPVPELTRPADIARALRAGGYVLYMRHGRTSQDELALEAQSRETGRFSIDDCATQRNLSAEGRAEVQAAGAQFRRLGLPVSRYLSSRYCRVAQTAQAYADRIDWSEPLTSEGPVVKSPERIAGVRALLSQPPPPGTNTMLFAHQGIFYEATRLTVQEGWAVVLLPGVFTRVIARIAPGDWAKLLEAQADAGADVVDVAATGFLVVAHAQVPVPAELAVDDGREVVGRAQAEHHAGVVRLAAAERRAD